ncbi:MAG TPA: hypothetical protein VEJ84_21125 [Acidimicrobiales bacterium]|nr:hypothetical protein [Acidimicrobiales bacterium]
MCERLAELRSAAACLLARFDPTLVAADDLPRIIRDAGALEKMMATLSSLAAARLAEVGHSRDAARHLAQATGTSLGEAARSIEAAHSALVQPEVQEAAQIGVLSRDQLFIVAGAAGINPAATARLLELARTGSVQELADEAGRARAAGRGADARRQAIKDRRYLRTWADAEGACNLRARGLPEELAKVVAAVKPFADRAFEAARKEGRREAPEAYAFDGLVGLADAGGGDKVRTEVLIRVDHAALVRGYAVDGEICDAPGAGALTPQAVLDVIDSGDPVLKALITKGKDVLTVAHLGRRPNAHQQTALDWMFPTCAAEHCSTRAAYLQTDHRIDWSKTHVTVLDLLDRLCGYDHYLKTHEGWQLVEGRGKRAFVSPADPRHPQNAGQSGGGGPGDEAGPEDRPGEQQDG